LKIVSIVSLILIVVTSVTLTIAGSAHITLNLSIILLLLALTASRRTVARVLKAILSFNFVYFLTSLLVQAISFGSIELLGTALQFLKLTSLALSSFTVAGIIFPFLIRKACSNQVLLTLLIAMRSVADSYITLSDTLDAIRINYGTSKKFDSSTIRAAIESLPVLVLDAVLRRFESAITMLPSTYCRAKYV